MKSIFSFCISALFLFAPLSCEVTKDAVGLSEADVVAGLKQALQFGSDSAATSLHKVNGYYGNELLRIGLPPEANQVIQYFKVLPGGEAVVENVVKRMNQGAEKAAGKAAPIFLNAITSMTISDGFTILEGTDSAATAYLRAKTFTQLTGAFSPDINSAMNEVGAADAWNSLFTTYNTYANTLVGQIAGFKPVNPNLGEYATNRALKGLFVKVAEQELLIRKDPTKRVTDLLKRVFAEQDKK